MTKTNIYLEKIAARLKDEGDAAKAFAQTSAAGYAGHIGGALVGAAGGALLAAKSPKVRNLASRAVGAAGRLGERFKNTGVGKFIGKHTQGGGPTGLVGGIAGGVIGEEGAQYAATRHNIMKTKKDKRNG